MQFFSQTDLRWKKLNMGRSLCSLGRFGCTTCSVCMVISKKGTIINPDVAASKFKYTSDGLIDWIRTDFSPLKFIWRGYTWGGPDQKKVKDWLNSGKFAILKVRNKFIPAHWVAADRWGITGLGAIDPLGGVPMNPITFLLKYKITGYVLFE